MAAPSDTMAISFAFRSAIAAFVCSAMASHTTSAHPCGTPCSCMNFMAASAARGGSARPPPRLRGLGRKCRYLVLTVNRATDTVVA